ncbi:MAG: hypothetical protein AAF989_01620 [Planctomycetota bacterium]
MNHEDNSLLIHYLTEQGHSWPEIQQVLSKLNEHDQRTIRESVFDSIETGSFNLEKIVEEAKQ